MKNNSSSTVLARALLIFNCNDPRVTEQLLHSIIDKANQSLGCFKLRDYMLNQYKTVVRFELVMTYSSMVDMLNKFAWLTLQVVQENFIFSLDEADFGQSEERKEVVNAHLDENGKVVKAVVSTDTAFTKIKRKRWGY